MHTYLRVLFSSDGARPSDVKDALAGLGFRPQQGAHDFGYEWPSSASVDEVVQFGDKIHAELSGLGCIFEMETI